ncbi:SPOR domain-containing protein [Parvibaculum sp.]|jgi:hypothetical protein|uniref:SPOR domain-containing protein n=1 Tax=Parvibaculum sp. TaxID=2024848 RepID=UPI001B142543|nr:SPOR domain-containing protein [Parvibaculum sp.]MBO6633780.1 SPOR domain-containing protein [Parvibaculum sp.]MBO6677629.1 SPOR domain-containing protein [Parvibaculum sp.]MBO6684487.1 SPOR domain-containing protein [Parvibaculum sp.]MBO6904921.1 SPOR domain-containing protein [Parvibaculum sp.]
MNKKPASLTSDLLARKGEAGPSSVDPVSRVTLSPGRQENLSGIGANEGPSRGLYAAPATERPEMYGTDEEERPSPPEPEIIYTPEDEDGGGRTRLIAGAFVGIAILGGVIVALSLNDGGSGVAPVSPDVTSAAEEAPPPAERAEAPTTAPVTEMPADTTPGTEAEAPASPEATVPGETETASTPESAPPASAADVPAAGENAPTSIAPPAAPEETTPAPQETAAAEPAAPAPAATPASGGAYVVQIMALREEGAAKTAWAALQKKHPSILGGHALDVEKADLGDKGTFYRVRAAGFETKAAAQTACTSLKSAGQDCLVKAR